MIATKNIALIFFGMIGTSGLSLAGAYTASFDQLQNILGNDLLDQNNNEEEWKALQKALNTKEKVSEDKYLGIKNAKEANSSPDNGNKIKEWCLGKYKSNINKLFPSPHQSELLSYAREFCVLTIKQKINESNRVSFEGETDKAKFIEKFGSLKSHSNDEELDGELKEIKKGEKEKDWEKLKNWCKSAYNKGYKNSQNKVWKNADSYCKK